MMGDPLKDPGPDSRKDPGPDPRKDPGPDSRKDPGLDPLKDPGPDPLRDPGPDPLRDPGPDPGSDPLSRSRTLACNADHEPNTDLSETLDHVNTTKTTKDDRKMNGVMT
jgi:hypothetical protein